jgi:tetratricopeptide (TPR) repeat protein
VHAERALTLRPTDPEALELRGVLRARLWDLGPTDASDTLVFGAERDLLAATEAKPNLARSWHTLALLYWVRGRFAESQLAARRALEADAYLREVPSVFQNLVFASVHLGQFQEARSWCDQGLARFPGDPRLSECRLVVLGWLARGSSGIAEGWRVLAQIEREDSLGILDATWAYRRMFVAVIVARTGLRDSAEAVITRTRSHARARQQLRGATLLAEAYAHLLLGKREEALRMIRAGVQTDVRIRFLAAATPWFQELHDDPRFSVAVGVEQRAVH